MEKEVLTIVMLSGGIDSTGLLYKLLTQTKDNIVAHHVDFINRERRHNIELHSIINIVEYLKKNTRHFDFTKSAFLFPYPYIGWDIINTMYIGGLVSKNYIHESRTVRLCIGDNKDDFAPRQYNGKSLVAQMMGILASLDDPRVEIQTPPIIINPVINMSKKEIMQMMPKELLDMTWSCRTPIISENETTYETCGKCITCMDFKDLGIYEYKKVTIKPAIKVF